MMELSYRRHRFPPVVIQHAVWLYLRFTLSYRDVEDLLAERGLDVSYETVRSWVLKFGPVIARRLARGTAGSLARWWVGSPGNGCTCGGPSTTRRGPRHVGPAPPRHPSGAAADAQA